ncbi:hypothetical protein [Streptomyces sp. 891-h]|uniref:hypothetical protein n=1 Tax=Streptomyces sp. 891-h TaxID=2720714 RepID=UPI00325A683E
MPLALPAGLTGRHALDGGYHAVIEGILYANHYGAMLAQLLAGRWPPLRAWSLPFAETLARHVAKPIAGMVSRTQLRDWSGRVISFPAASRPSSAPTEAP